jgi:hypothetical protein
MGDDARTNQSLKFVVFDGVNIDNFLERFKMFLGGLDFACWELIATDAGDRANMPAAGAALRTWNQQNRKIISILCLGLPQWCVSIVLENVGEPANAKAGFEALIAEFRVHNPNYYADMSSFIVKCTLADFDNVVTMFTEMNEKNAILRAFNVEDAIPVSQMIALVTSKLVADPRFDPITSAHRLRPYVGLDGYNTMKRAAITIHMNTVALMGTLPTTRSSKKTETALTSKETTGGNRDPYPDCSTCDKKHPPGRCWVQFPHLKKEFYDNQKLRKDAKFKRKEEAKAAKEIVLAASTTPAPAAPTEPSADVAMRAEIMAFREELRALAQAKQGFESVPTESGFLSVEDTPDAEPEYCFHACGHTADQCLALTPAASGGDYVTTFNCPKTTLPQLPEMEITMTDKNHQSVSLLTLYWLPVFLFLLGVLLIITSALLLWPQPVVESSPEPVCPMKNGVFTTNIFPDDFTTAISTDSPLECAFPGNTGVFTTDIFPDDFTTAISTDFMVEAAFPAKSGTNHSEPCDVLVDMGATSHILALPDKYFIRPQRVRTPIKQLDGIVYSLLRGDVAYKYVDSEGVPRVSTFYNSLQSPPGSTEYLASISKWEDDGIKVYQNDRYISDRAGVKCPLVRRVNLYFLPGVKFLLPKDVDKSLTRRDIRFKPMPFYHWHCRLGHMHADGMKRTQNVTRGMEFTEVGASNLTIPKCDHCEAGNMSKLGHQIILPLGRPDQVLKVIYLDTFGKMSVPAFLTGEQHASCIIDGGSKLGAWIGAKKKSDMFDNLMQYVSSCKALCNSFDGTNFTIDIIYSIRFRW